MMIGLSSLLCRRDPQYRIHKSLAPMECYGVFGVAWIITIVSVLSVTYRPNNLVMMAMLEKTPSKYMVTTDAGGKWGQRWSKVQQRHRPSWLRSKRLLDPFRPVQLNVRDSSVNCHRGERIWHREELGSKLDRQEYAWWVEDMDGEGHFEEWKRGLWTDDDVYDEYMGDRLDENLTSIEKAHGRTLEELVSRCQKLGFFTNRGRTVYILHFDMYEGEWGQAIANLMEKDGRVNELVLHENSLWDVGTEPIAEMLTRNPALEVLKLTHQHISDVGAKYLADALEENNDLDTLSLYGNQITAVGAKYISQALMKNTRLRKLCLWHNKIGDDGAIALAEMLRENDYLEDLNIADCDIGPRGAAALAEALRVNDRLEVLDLRDNTIRDEGAIAISKALVKNLALRTLNVWQNEITDKTGIPALQYAIDLNYEYKNQTGEEIVAWVYKEYDIGNFPNTTHYTSELGAVLVDEDKIKGMETALSNYSMDLSPSPLTQIKREGSGKAQIFADFYKAKRKKEDVNAE